MKKFIPWVLILSLFAISGLCLWAASYFEAKQKVYKFNYFREPRTGFCFMTMGSKNSLGLAHVPCHPNTPYIKED